MVDVYTYFCLEVSVQVFQVLDLFAGYMQLCSRIWCVCMCVVCGVWVYVGRGRGGASGEYLQLKTLAKNVFRPPSMENSRHQNQIHSTLNHVVTQIVE